MHLLNLTLSPPTNISLAAVGSFSGTKGQEIIAVRGSTRVEILKLNTTTGQRQSNCNTKPRGQVDADVNDSRYDLFNRSIWDGQECQRVPSGWNDQR